MKFDSVIIGGGLAGLICGIRLQKKGLKCAIISVGQSALHFSSGSFDLLDRLPDGTAVENPVDAVKKLDESHPYAKIGDRFHELAKEAETLLKECGVEVAGSCDRNTLRITPMGTFKPTWLTMTDFESFDSDKQVSGKKILIANIAGFLDFNTKFVATALEAAGAECKIISVNVPALEKLRVSPTEMRASNIARALEKEENLNALISILKPECSGGFDCVALPAVFGLSTNKPVKVLKSGLNIPVCLVPTMPPSVPGIRTQQQLRHVFERLGGVYMLGDTVLNATVDGEKVKEVFTVNHGNIGFKADNFILATGSYFSSGLVARPNGIFEPVFGCDLDAETDRSKWYDVSFFKPQQYMSYGVATDGGFRAKVKGKTMDNLYAIGSVLSGFNALHEGCGAGVSMLTGLFVADNLVKKG